MMVRLALCITVRKIIIEMVVLSDFSKDDLFLSFENKYNKKRSVLKHFNFVQS